MLLYTNLYQGYGLEMKILTASKLNCIPWIHEIDLFFSLFFLSVSPDRTPDTKLDVFFFLQQIVVEPLHLQPY